MYTQSQNFSQKHKDRMCYLWKWEAEHVARNLHCAFTQSQTCVHMCPCVHLWSRVHVCTYVCTHVMPKYSRPLWNLWQKHKITEACDRPRVLSGAQCRWTGFPLSLLPRHRAAATLMHVKDRVITALICPPRTARRGSAPSRRKHSSRSLPWGSGGENNEQGPREICEASTCLSWTRAPCTRHTGNTLQNISNIVDLGYIIPGSGRPICIDVAIYCK